MDLVILLGLLAGLFTTWAFLPQVIKTWKRKEADGISFWMYLIYCTGILLWLGYGLLIKDLPLILANLVTLGLSATVLFFRIRYRNRS